MVDIIIIGAGVAGLTSAIYALRANLSVIVFDKNYYGGQVTLTSDIQNYPGIAKISGVDFAISVYNQAVALGADIRFEEVNEISLDGEIKTVKSQSGEYQTKTIIIANGAERRKLNCEGEMRLSSKGVSYCATCDGALYKGKDVAIVGGGNTALEDALFLSNNCNKVYLIHRRDSFRGEKILAESVLGRENIEVIYDSAVEEICGEETVSSIKVKSLKKNSVREIDVKAIFIAIGLEPKNHMFKSIPLDKHGYIIAGEDCITEIDGVYVAGDTRTKVLRQIVTAASDGAIAAFQAGNYINSKINQQVILTET